MKVEEGSVERGDRKRAMGTLHVSSNKIHTLLHKETQLLVRETHANRPHLGKQYNHKNATDFHSCHKTPPQF